MPSHVWWWAASTMGQGRRSCLSSIAKSRGPTSDPGARGTGLEAPTASSTSKDGASRCSQKPQSASTLG